MKTHKPIWYNPVIWKFENILGRSNWTSKACTPKLQQWMQQSLLHTQQYNSCDGRCPRTQWFGDPSSPILHHHPPLGPGSLSSLLLNQLMGWDNFGGVFYGLVLGVRHFYPNSVDTSK